ncbi:DUF2786 domain-containing protein [Pectobacterium brasiliense]|uniref:DUF2786 domain-containing protein n=1 Tax=Pectobacterium brasiliense TaxID=180957 RepID=UPI00069AAEE6|nr:DUF2786 domain-containing protein [Pectobacterium brasiliense]MCG5047323.1 DUF2786 domain-containing protein [Pectobacterium brasiliense]
MSATNKEKHLQKLKKLLNLARRTTNPNEAANAMSQAQALMRQHGLTATDVDLMEISEASSKTAPSQANNPPRYMLLLAGVIRRAFGVECYISFSPDPMLTKRIVVFFGPNERPQVAAYAFDVLSRQLMKARREFVAGMRKNIKSATKIARADNFCEGWAQGVHQVIEDFVASEAEKTLMAAYDERLHQRLELETTKGRDANKARGTDVSRTAGYIAGKNASIHHGVNGVGPLARIGRTE